MTDEQLHIRMINKRMILVAVMLLLLSGGLVYYWISTTPAVKNYESQLSQESSLQGQIQSLEDSNGQLRATIEQAGKELISFSEDKIKYINLASTLSQEYDVHINKLTVSDVWDEGQMSGMTTSIEVQGSLEAVQKFVDSYCDTRYTNRINVVSCRPIDKYPWVERNIDGVKVLKWFDLTKEEAYYKDKMSTERAQLNKAAMEAGLASSAADDYFQKEKDERDPITLDKIFADKTFKVYLVIDFLGRQ